MATIIVLSSTVSLDGSTAVCNRVTWSDLYEGSEGSEWVYTCTRQPSGRTQRLRLAVGQTVILLMYPLHPY